MTTKRKMEPRRNAYGEKHSQSKGNSLNGLKTSDTTCLLWKPVCTKPSGSCVDIGEKNY